MILYKTFKMRGDKFWAIMFLSLISSGVLSEEKQFSPVQSALGASSGNNKLELSPNLSLAYPCVWKYSVDAESGNDSEAETLGYIKACNNMPGNNNSIYATLTVKPGWRYQFSAYVKYDKQQDNGSLILLCVDGEYYKKLEGNIKKREKINWSSDAGKIRKSFNWQYIENMFETPDAAGLFEIKAYPVKFYGKGESFLRDVKFIDLGPAKIGKEVYSLPFCTLEPWKLDAHVNETSAEIPEGTSLSLTTEYDSANSPKLKLNYHFPSKKHDAAMLSTNVSILSGNILAVRIYGDGSGHELFAILFDKSGEAHYLRIGPIYWYGWKVTYAMISGLYIPPATRWNMSCEHWGGDGNQTLDFPITQLTIGINDIPDKFQGKGKIAFDWMKIYE